jgi:probable addiction module antidote protein
MKKAKVRRKVTYAPFEVADYLESEEAIAEFLSLAARDENPGVLLKALGDVAMRGMAEVAKASGLGRESLYKTLAPPITVTVHETLTGVECTVHRNPAGRTQHSRQAAQRRRPDHVGRADGRTARDPSRLETEASKRPKHRRTAAGGL